MAIAHSKVTAQGQVSIPAVVRRKLGIGPGSLLAWEEEGGRIVLHRAGRYSSEDAHRVLFPDRDPAPRTLEEIEEALQRHAKDHLARR
jgi:AbrB family looped-hinge helix DNA binding protein